MPPLPSGMDSIRLGRLSLEQLKQMGTIRMSLALKHDTVSLLGVRLSSLRMNELLDITDEHIKNREKLLIGVVNVAKLVKMQKDTVLRRSVQEADLTLADGMPIIWLSRMLREPLPERVAGIDIMLKLLKRANDKHYRVFFLGARAEVLQNMVDTIQRDYPGIQIAGYRDGYFGREDECRVAEGIKQSNADILFVGINSPKKENFLKKWQSLMDVPVCHGVGGSFDVLAGVTKRAPLWMRKWGLEWFYRLIQEPKRMWKRYLVTNTIFVKLSFEAILRARLSRLFHRSGLASASTGKNQSK